MTGLKRLGPPPALIALAGGMVLAAVLGMYHLGTRDIWYDEAFSVSVARLDGTALVRAITSGDPSQGLYYLLLHFWIPVVGESEAAVRSLSVIFGVATVPALYLTAKELFDHKIAATAALLLPISSFFNEQTQEARGYSMVMFMVTIATLLYVRAARSGGVKSWIAYGIVGVLAVFTHAFALLVLGTHAATSFLHKSEKKRRSLMVLISGGVIVGGVVVALPIIRLVGSRWNWIRFRSGDDLATQIGGLVGQQGWLLLLYLFLACMGVALFVQSLVERRGGDDAWRYSIPAAWFFLPIIASLLGSFITPMFVLRYLSICIPALALLVALAIWECRPPFIMGLVIGTIAVTSASSLHSGFTDPPYFKSRHWEAASTYLLTNAEEGDVVLFEGEVSAVVFTYYRSILGIGPEVLSLPYLPPTTAHGTSSARRLSEGLEVFVAEDPRPPRVWVLSSYGFPPRHVMEALAGYEATDASNEITGIEVTLFRLSSMTVAPDG